MEQPDTPGLRHHEDPDLFREAINFTAAETGFSGRLIEKDYFATLFLSFMAGGTGESLVFKGGTCLAKVHAGFYRLSEDLDFVIPVKEPSTRKERRRLVAGAKELFDSMAHRPGGMHVAEMLRGANQSRQYLGRVRYRSVLTGEEQTIKIEVSLRESLLAPAEKSAAKTILISPVKEDQLVDPIPILCINFKEAMAEKFRAALTRREVAIRDFYDIDYAVRNLARLSEIDLTPGQ